MSATFTNFCETFCSTEWFQQQQEFRNDIENMEVDELNKCLAKFYVSVRKTDGSYYKKTSLLSIRAALDRHLKAPPNNKKFSICDNNMFSHANKTLNAYLKHLSSTGEIAGTVHKEPLSTEVIQKLYKKGELAETSTRDPRALMQTAWLFISLYFGKRGRENQAAMKKSILRLVTTADGAEYFELNRNEPGAVLTMKNHQDGIDSTEDHSNSKIFAVPGSSQCPVEVLKTYLSHLNPDLESLFQRPKDMTAKFNPDACKVWYDARKLGHNSLENMLRNMTTRAEITPYFTNHSLKATTVTVLSERNVETRQIKAVTGHRSDTSIESYCERPTLRQFRNMSTALSSFVHGGESAQTDVLAICPPPLPPSGPQNAVVPACPSVAMQQSYLSRQQENFLVENGVNPGAILPSGSFQNCSFNFNINITNSHD